MQTSFPGIIVLLLTTAAGLAAADVTPRTPLAQLLASRFGELSLSEEKLAQAAPNGETADCSELSGKDRIIRGELLSWVCTNPSASVQLTSRGVSISGAEIVNNMDLEGARIAFPIRGVQCVFRDAIILNDSHVASLDLTGSSVQELNAINTRSEGSLYLRYGFKAKGGVNLIGAGIGGNLDCNLGEFISKDQMPALNVNSVQVKGGVYLRYGFKAEGEVNLVGARIDGSFDCRFGEFISKNQTAALVADDTEVNGNVFLSNGFKAEGGVILVNAKIDGYLDCSGGQFIGKNEGRALDANSVEVKGAIYLRNGFKAEGEVNLVGAKIDGNLECDGGQFIGNAKVLALNANGVVVKGSVLLRKVRAEGGVILRAEGGVNLINAKIEGNLECDGGQFIGNAKAPALDADGVKIEGYAFLRDGFKAEGTVVFFNGYVGRSFQWWGVESPEKAILDLRLVRVGTLLSRPDSWPTQGNLRVDGSIYEQIDDWAPPSAEIQLAWLKRQPRDRFLSQPFEQLASVLRKMGLEEDARKVMIAKNEEHAHYVQWRLEWLWYGLFGQLVGYGYSPWRAFGISLVVIGIGWWLFRRGYRQGLLTATSGDAYGTVRGSTHQLLDSYPKFNAFIYSLEAFVPLVKLGLGDQWTPNANRGESLRLGNVSFRTGSLLRGYLWFHIISGWVLTTLWVGGITGLVKT